VEIFSKIPAIDFLGKRMLAVGFTTVLITISIASLAVRGLNFGIDFSGGTLIEVSYSEAVQTSDVRATLADAGFADATVQYFGTARDILVRLPARGNASSAKLSGEVMAALRKPYNESVAPGQAPGGAQRCRAEGGGIAPCRVQMRRVEFVGPQVGSELAEKGGLAMLYALIGILIYVAWRFEWRFSVGAVVATIHDVIITVGFFSVFQLEFSLTVLAAVLAVIGYSLNDTIVVYDRIRENFRKMRKSSVIETMNVAINETLPRTTLTSLTTLLVLFALLSFGGEIIRGFSLALIVGIFIGTFSSIYVASPVAMWLGVSREDMLPVKKEGAVDNLP
jgi:preprotein translocase subunit SecF